MSTPTKMSPEAATELCKQMNEKYPVMVYAMAKKAGSIPTGHKVTSSKVKSVTNTECTLSYVTCRGDACSMPQTAIYRFQPPLQSDKIKMLQLQSKICSPNFLWLFTKPKALVTWIFCALLSIATMGLGVEKMTELIDRMPAVDQTIRAIFGVPHTFALFVLCLWCFCVVAHFVECAIAYRRCEMRLRFSNEVSSMWGLMVFIAGWPIYQELQEYVEIKEQHKKTN